MSDQHEDEIDANASGSVPLTNTKWDVHIKLSWWHFCILLILIGFALLTAAELGLLPAASPRPNVGQPVAPKEK